MITILILTLLNKMFVASTNMVDSNDPRFSTGVNYIFILKKVIDLHLSAPLFHDLGVNS